MTVTINGSGTISGVTTMDTTVVNQVFTTPKATTTIGVGNATPSASGSGISFPATQSASSDANTLDDYEEGTWTPTFTNLTVVGTPTYAGFYTKIGRLVYFQVSVSVTTSTASTANSTFISNLPFAAVGVAVCAVTSSVVANYGTGYIGGNSVYTPSWIATANTIAITGVYYTT